MFEPPNLAELDLRTCADELDASVDELRRVEARRLGLVAHWADLHCPPPPATPFEIAGGRARPGGSDGTPEITEFTATELGMLLGTSTMSASALLRDVLDLRHRLPAVWEAVMTGQVEGWVGRKVARATAVLTLEQAQWVDTQVVEALVGLPFGRALSVVEGKVLAADPAGHEERRRQEAGRRYVTRGSRPNELGLRTLVAQTTAGDVARLYAMVQHLAGIMAAGGDTDPADVRRAKALGLLANPAMACVLLARTAPPEVAAEPESTHGLAVELGRAIVSLGETALDRLRPRVALYLHLSQQAVEGAPGSQVVRTEGLGALSKEQLQEWLGTDRVVVRPVIDVAGHRSVHQYEVPVPMSETLLLREPYEVFPWGTLLSREADADHTRRYVPPDEGGPPDQTSLDNLGPLGRGHHRAKTFGGFVLHQPLPGRYYWRTPSGYWFRVDHRGTARLGRKAPPLVEQDPRTRSAMESRLLELVLDQAA